MLYSSAMLRDDILLSTKLSPPRLHRRLLARPALIAKLRETLDYRITLVQAGTGYGKSTALAALAQDEAPLFWYSLDSEDADPQRFLAYLIAAFRTQLPNLSEAPLAVLHELGGGSNAEGWTQVVDALINALSHTLTQPSLFVLDDYHFVAGSADINALVERFITYLPPYLHVVLSARYPLTKPDLVVWRAKGEVLDIARDDLAFQPSEIEVLFAEAYGLHLSPADIATLVHKTEGWPIALQLVWQGLRNQAEPSAAELLAQEPASVSLNVLFEFLARDVLDRQPPAISSFLRDTAVLRELTPAACDAVTLSCNSAAMLDRLHNLDLFIVALEGRAPYERHYRYHHLFHDFLSEQAATDPEGVRERHVRAAKFFQMKGDGEEANFHWLNAGAYVEAAEVIEATSEAALRSGRLDTVAGWIDALPPAVLAEHPQLQAYLGDVYRLRSRFDDALAWYAQAEGTWRARNDLAGVSRALRGQALVYLDTVQPAQAESLLEEALRFMEGLADREAHARILELLAENKLNLGKPRDAEAMRAQAQMLREEGPSDDVISVRVKLRTGQLDEAQRILQGWAEAERRHAERGQAHAPRAHRETVLLLSLIHAFRGQGQQAFRLAQEGIALGEQFESPFVTAVSHSRLGHAWQLRTDQPARTESAFSKAADEAIRCYHTSITLGDRLAVRRTRLEAMWGLTRAYGFLGDLASAERAAAEGVEIGRQVGDLWVTALVELALGASFVLAGRAADSLEIVTRALFSFRECGDSLGRAAARLWLSLAYLDLRQSERFVPCVEDLLGLCETHRYNFLFTAPTLLGPPDPRRLVPLLIEARARQCRPVYASQLLTEVGLPDIEVHPGYQLRIQTFGAFRVWRSDLEVAANEWKRDKARQLLQLFLIHRGRPLQRDEIVERLWPTLSPEAAIRDFKVALNALNKALEPARLPDAPFAFIVREGTAYFMRPEADVWIDAVAFKREAEAGLRALESRAGSSADASEEAIGHLRTAFELHDGGFLLDALYEDWASEERERLLALYLRVGDKLAEALVEHQRFDESLNVCQTILAHDKCWEQAYRLMMIAYARQGNRSQAMRTYERCISALQDELDVRPSPATLTLHERIKQSDAVLVTDL